MHEGDLVLNAFYWVRYKPTWAAEPTGIEQVAQWAGELGWYIVGSDYPVSWFHMAVLEGPLKPPSLPQEPTNAAR